MIIIIRKKPKEYEVKREDSSEIYVIPSITRALRKAKELFELQVRADAAAAPLLPLSPAPQDAAAVSNQVTQPEGPADHEPRKVVLEGVQVSDKAATGSWMPGVSHKLQEIKARQESTNQQPNNFKEQS
jgi:hypothetical protein